MNPHDDHQPKNPARRAMRRPAERIEPAPATAAGPPGALVDTHDRTVRDLRISVTDRCNLRCVYCMPAEGMPWLPKGDLLTYEEITRFARICLDLGVTGIRLTGGEPTVRADLPQLIRMLDALKPGLDLSLTTNALKLAAMGDDLKAAGLKRVNVKALLAAEDEYGDDVERELADLQARRHPLQHRAE